MEILPDFILAGAPKTGSTTLYRLLGSHPDTLLAEPDNPNYFGRERNRPASEFYRDYFPDDSSVREAEVVGEGTVDYLYSPDSPPRMREVLGPDLKLIFLLRDPVERAVSHYWHKHKKMGDQRSLEDVFQLRATTKQELIHAEKQALREAREEGRIDPTCLEDVYPRDEIHFQYLRNSYYSDFLCRFRDCFPTGNMLVLLTEQLNQEPGRVLREVQQFLNLAEQRPTDLEQRSNETIVPRRDTVSSLVHNYLRPLAGALFPGKKPDLLNKLYHRLTFREKPATPGWIPETLGPLFEPELETLAGDYGLKVHEHWDLAGGS